MSGGGRGGGDLGAVLDVFFPEVFAVDELDGEPEAAMPWVIVGLENADEVAGGGGEGMEEGFGQVYFQRTRSRDGSMRDNDLPRSWTRRMSLD
jgi:hypothetical protein